MLDVGLIAAAKTAVAAKPRKYVTPAMVLAVVNQESHGMPYFVDIKPGSEYQLNLSEAITHKERDKKGNVLQKIPTGLTEPQIRGIITIPATIDGWPVPRVMVGQKAKFRFEYGYWKQHADIKDPAKRFRLCCSWGLPQFMGTNIAADKTGDEADKFTQRWMADVPLQLLYCAGFVDELLERSHGDIERAYKGYNSGDIDSTDVAVIARAKAVHAAFNQFDDLLRGMK